MFLHYTDLGVGYLVALRQIVRDYLGLWSSVPVDSMDINEGGSDGEGDEQMDVDLADEEWKDEDDEIEDEEGESDDRLQVDDVGEEVEEETDELLF
jgi:hypothetical protein